MIDSVPAKTENTVISAVVLGHYYVACLWLFTLATLKNYYVQ